MRESECRERNSRVLSKSILSNSGFEVFISGNDSTQMARLRRLGKGVLEEFEIAT
jgi:hypothetical protein